MVHWGKEHAVRFVGQFVHCHSMYGVHEGMLHRALRDGIILVHHVQLTGDGDADVPPFVAGVYASEDSPDFTEAQFFPGPGLFIPYGGIYGLWPRPGIWI